MINLAICDDDKFFRSDLRKFINTELELCGLKCRIAEFDCAETLNAWLEKTDCHILFLDIKMKGMDGVSAARNLRRAGKQTQIIFVTCYADYVFQGYDVRAVHYILKPYDPEKVASALHTALDLLEAEAENYYVINQKQGSIRLPLSSVKYFSSNRRKIHVVTTSGEYTFYEKLGDLESRLPDAFVRSHNRYLIHLKYLQEIRKNTAIVDGEELPVSRSCKSGLSIAFAKYMLR